MPGTDGIDDLLAELHAFGERHGGMWNAGPDVGALLAWLVRGLPAQRVLEIGTSNGYSAIWIARVLTRTTGHLITLEVDPGKADMARANLKQAGLDASVTIVQGPAMAALGVLGGTFDLVFIDAAKPAYPDYLHAVLPLLKPGAIIVADNMRSHAEQTRTYRDIVDANVLLDSVSLEIGDGLYLSRVVDTQ